MAIFVKARQDQLASITWECILIPRSPEPASSSFILEHPGYRQMSKFKRRQLYWPKIRNEIYAAVGDCQSCATSCRTTKRQRKLRLFWPAGPLEFVNIDNLGPVPKKITGSQHIVILKRMFLQVTKGTAKTETTAATVSSISINDWYRASEYRPMSWRITACN